MSTLIVTSVVVVYAIVSMAYVASSEQRATRYRNRDRATPRPEPLPCGTTAPVVVASAPTPSRPSLSLPEWLQPPESGVEFIRPAPVELELTGVWRRARSSASLVMLLTLIGAVVAILLGVAAAVTVLALKNAAG